MILISRLRKPLPNCLPCQSLLMYAAGKLFVNHDGVDYNFSNSTPRLAQASLHISIGPFRLLRTATNDVCLCGIGSGEFGDMCLSV